MSGRGRGALAAPLAALALGNPAGPPNFSPENQEYFEKPLNGLSSFDKSKIDVSEELKFIPSDWQSFKEDFLRYVNIHFDNLGSIYTGSEQFPVQLVNEILGDADDRKSYFRLRKSIAAQILKKVILRFHMVHRDDSTLDSDTFVNAIQNADDPAVMFTTLETLTSRATAPGELFFMDVWFSNIASDGGRTCALLITDAFSKKLWIKFMTHKAETTSKVIEWVQERKLEGMHIGQWAVLPRSSTVRSDYGGEFRTPELAEFFKVHNITQNFSPPMAHCHVAERHIRTVKESTAAYLQAAKVELTRASAIKVGLGQNKVISPYVFWADAANYSVYVLNKMPHAGDAHKSRNQMWDSSIETEDMGHLRVFGCRVYCKNYESLREGGAAPSKMTQQEHGMKSFPTWGDKGWEGIFMGVDPSVPGTWRVLNLKTKKFVNTQNMLANENLLTSVAPQKVTRESLLSLIQLKAFSILTPQQIIAIDEMVEDNKHLLYQDWYFSPDEFDPVHPLDRLMSKTDYKRNKEAALRHSDVSASMIPDDSDDEQEVDMATAHLAEVRRRGDIIEEFAMKADIDVPTTYIKATKGPERHKWIPSIAKETQSLFDRDVFKVIPISTLPEGAQVLKKKWVFDKKADGRYKSRYTIKGCGQREGIDYDEVFAPVVRYSTLRVLCALSAAYDYHLHQMDVDTAFLYGRLGDDDPQVFCELPEDYPIPEEYRHIDRKKLCGLALSAIYGLKQASRTFYLALQLFLLEKLGFTRSDSDPCLYFKEVRGVPIWVAVFVDDLAIASHDLALIKAFKKDMRSEYDMKDLDEMKKILGIEVIRDWEKGTLTLVQTKYMEDMLKKFDVYFNADKPDKKRRLPMNSGKADRLSISHCPTTTEERELADRFPYREVVGSCMAVSYGFYSS